MAKRGRGRPKLGLALRASRRVRVHLTDSEHRILQELSRAAGQRPARFARRQLLEGLLRQISESTISEILRLAQREPVRSRHA